MEELNPSDQQEVAAVETSLFNRMVKNALLGFLKTAVIGALIGLALGGIAGAIGLFPAAAVTGSASPIIQGALHGAVWLAGLAGSFGAVSGIQSTRDTRRWFLRHENPELQSPEQTREQTIIIQPELTQKSQACDHFQKIISDKAQDKFESPRIG